MVQSSACGEVAVVLRARVGFMLCAVICVLDRRSMAAVCRPG